MDIDALVKEARKHIDDPDAIIDPYDLTFVWVNEKAAKSFGYSASEMTDKQVLDFTLLPRTKVMKITLTLLHGLFKQEIPIKTKGGKRVDKRIKYKVIRFEGCPYFVTKFL